MPKIASCTTKVKLIWIICLVGITNVLGRIRLIVVEEHSMSPFKILKVFPPLPLNMSEWSYHNKCKIERVDATERVVCLSMVEALAAWNHHDHALATTRVGGSCKIDDVRDEGLQY